MGGDHGPRVTVPAACDFLSANTSAFAILLGDQALVQEQLKRQPDAITAKISDRLTVVHCEQQVTMEEKPTEAMRNKPQSSLNQGLNLLAQGRADGFVSAGNTGALVAMSVRIVGTFNDISRPAICTAIPTQKGQAYLLDMGANPVCTAQQLYQFARFASRIYRLVEERDNPSVGLLNIGVEAIKGTREIRDAAELIEQDSELNYGGFVEGDGLFAGQADIVVCDGFSGNVALKSVEGAAHMILAMLRSALRRNLWSRFLSVLLLPTFKSFQEKVDPDRYNGAFLLGLQKVVVKSHGGASREGFKRALDKAADHIERNLPQRLLHFSK